MLEAKVGEVPVTIDDACAIRASAVELLRATQLRDPVPLPDDPHVDAFGKWRFGAWTLEPDPRDDREELQLAYVIADTAVVRVRQEITIRRKEDGTWKAVSTGSVHYHRRR